MLNEIHTLSVKTDEYLGCVMMSIVGKFRLYDYNFFFCSIKVICCSVFDSL